MPSNLDTQRPSIAAAITNTADSLNELARELTDEVIRLRENLAHRTNGGGPISQNTLHKVNGVLRGTPRQLQGMINTIKAASDAIEGKE